MRTLPMMKADVNDGTSIVVIDFDEDKTLASELSTLSKKNGRNFYHFSAGSAENYEVEDSLGQASYDPFISGTPSSNTDKVLLMGEHNSASAIYKNLNKEILQTLFSMVNIIREDGYCSSIPSIDWNNGSFVTLVSILSDKNLEEIASKCTGVLVSEKVLLLVEAVKKNNHAMEELKKKLTTIVSSEYGEWLSMKGDSKDIDLFQLTKDGGNVILFSLDLKNEPDFSFCLGSLILADLKKVSEERINEGINNLVHVYINNFHKVEYAVRQLSKESKASSILLTISQ